MKRVRFIPPIKNCYWAPEIERRLNIEKQVLADVIKGLQTMPEFIKAYEPDGKIPKDFISFGLTQRTLTQFSIGGWQKIESVCF